MKNVSIKLSLYVNYFVFAILLNSVGIVILKSQNVYGVGEIEASILEAYKDLPIAIVSFLIASFNLSKIRLRLFIVLLIPFLFPALLFYSIVFRVLSMAYLLFSLKILYLIFSWSPSS